MNRKDFRTEKTFIKDIKFTTSIEKYLWELFCTRILKRIQYESIDYGTDNSGNFSKTSNHNADYRLKLTIDNKLYDLLLEIKFAPTNKKAVFKVQDLKAYIKQNANILLIYNQGPENLKKPKHYNLDDHIDLLSRNIQHLYYALLSPAIMTKMLSTYKHEKLFFMGNKPSITVPNEDFPILFRGKKL